MNIVIILCYSVYQSTLELLIQYFTFFKDTNIFFLAQSEVIFSLPTFLLHHEVSELQ